MISDLYPLFLVFPLSSSAHHPSSGLECLSWLHAILNELAITWIHDSLRDIGPVLSTVASRTAAKVPAVEQEISGIGRITDVIDVLVLWCKTDMGAAERIRQELKAQYMYSIKIMASR